MNFGEFGIQALEPAYVTNRQIESARIAINRHIRRGGKVWINIFPDRPLTKRPAETRMGSGKGSPEHWVANVKPGRVVFEKRNIEFDLLLGIPPHRAPAVVRESGLVGESGWIEINPRTCETSYEGVYAIGDSTHIVLANKKTLPKAGLFAEMMGETVAERLADRFEGREPTAQFSGEGGCFFEVGNGEDIIDIILEQPVTAEFIAAKVYRYFVREEISDAVRADLGRTFRQSGYHMKPLLKRIFLSKDFYSTSSSATQVKSPVHLVVSTYRKMGLREIPTIPDFGRMTGSLGQSLFDPPNVAGWSGGRTWITPATLQARGCLSSAARQGATSGSTRSILAARVASTARPR